MCLQLTFPVDRESIKTRVWWQFVYPSLHSSPWALDMDILRIGVVGYPSFKSIFRSFRDLHGAF